MTIKDKILDMKPKEHVVLKTNPTESFEKKVSTEEGATIRRLMQEAKIAKSKTSQTFSSPVEVFLVAGDRVTTSKMSLEAGPILKSCDVIVVPADGVAMLTYQIQKQYNEQVTLAMMLKDSGFKAAYQAAK